VISISKLAQIELKNQRLIAEEAFKLNYRRDNQRMLQILEDQRKREQIEQ
jgi:hypothetical protein